MKACSPREGLPHTHHADWVARGPHEGRDEPEAAGDQVQEEHCATAVAVSQAGVVGLGATGETPS